jgi:ATP/maltotriose-dependent transcriptional regulator MalT
LTHYDPTQRSVRVALYSQDPRVICLVRHGNLVWYLGHPDRAARDAGEALALAEKLGHPCSRAYALTFESLLANDRGDVTWLRRNLAALTEEVEKEGLGGWFESFRIILEGWALTEGGEAQAGTDLMRRGLAVLEATRAQVTFPYFMALFAQGLRDMGAVEDGLSAISEAQEIGEPLRPDWVGRRFSILVAGTDLRAIAMRQLRHSHATALLAAGEHPKIVQERLGHSSISITLDTYSAVLPNMQRDAVERLAATMGDR